MTNKTTKIPKFQQIITSKNVQLLDKTPLIVLSKPWKIPVKSATYQKDSKNIDDKEEQGMKVEIDSFGKNGNAACYDPQES